VSFTRNPALRAQKYALLSDSYCTFSQVSKSAAKNAFVFGAAQMQYNSGSQTVVREGFSGGTRATFLSYSKSFVNSFLCYNSSVCYANVANSFTCYIYLKYIWANYVLLKPGVYTPTLKKYQVVRDLKKFENHCSTSIELTLQA